MNDDDDLWAELAEAFLEAALYAPLGMGAIIVFAGIATLLAYLYLS